ncbi:hypothetical protein L210DRAFT_2466752 [Boletus edulis BED1]|uniref:Uncharacterized protein n=1 Tax=Boletus edulis BED1 TaxID=1328754 RepID=A0AAD4BCD6_BOLED|nr:hypothetical protein L210DRAFT_2466752 [Boletus edulis BED1]
MISVSQPCEFCARFFCVSLGVSSMFATGSRASYLSSSSIVYSRLSANTGLVSKAILYGLTFRWCIQLCFAPTFPTTV